MFYGPGAEGFVYRYGITYADQVTSNYFPEAPDLSRWYKNSRQ
jgi:hypothetical protein